MKPSALLVVSVLAAALWPPPAAEAQTATAPTTPPSDLLSPEVHPDRRITFRLFAPRASEVTVAGEWSHPANSAEKMTRDATGVWSHTVGPVEANIYFYVFKVDGLTITDPVNPLVKLRARTSASVVEVPGGKLWEVRDVPHGTVATHTHASPVLGGAARQLHVYTPPGYEKSARTRYPVLYLLHGNNDLAIGWTMAGRAHLVLDNLIAEKKVVPMVVVMPWGHALPFGSKPPAGQPTNNDVFEQYLMKDVVPFIESRYRLAPGRNQRAVVGLSMGGTQALQIALRHPDRFGSVGLFGAGMTAQDFDARFGKLPLPRWELLVIGVGKEDPVLDKAVELGELLTRRGLKVTQLTVSGGHIYPVWRKLLVETAPLLFQNKQRHH
jgi:enterochelin esterase family protein